MTHPKTLFTEAERIVVLTGAGVSTASGIPDFQSTDESWPYERPREELISLSYFHENPTGFWKVYREVFGSKLSAEPNGFHRWLAALDATKEVTVITQNVDGLHQEAGSSQVIEVHGNLRYATCRRRCELVTVESVASEELPRCAICRKPLKPEVSLFGDKVHGLVEARKAILDADLFVTAGTSLGVFPVAELPYIAMERAELPRLWLNKEHPPQSHGYVFNHVWRGELSYFPQVVR